MTPEVVLETVGKAMLAHFGARLGLFGAPAVPPSGPDIEARLRRRLRDVEAIDAEAVAEAVKEVLRREWRACFVVVADADAGPETFVTLGTRSVIDMPPVEEIDAFVCEVGARGFFCVRRGPSGIASTRADERMARDLTRLDGFTDFVIADGGSVYSTLNRVYIQRGRARGDEAP
jgi:hypothetical protein